MSYFTFAQYQQLLGINNTDVNSVYVNFQIKKWSDMLNRLTATNFSPIPNNQEIVKSVNQCGDYKMMFGPFLRYPSVYSRRTGSNNWDLMTVDEDYFWIYPHFVSTVDSIQIAKPTIGIDWGCLSCICCCTEIKIVGDNRYSVALPDDLLDILVDLTTLLLDNDPKSYVSGYLPNNLLSQQVKRETDQTRTIEWMRDTNKYEIANKKLIDGPNNSSYASVILKYHNLSFNLNRRFHA